jgi:G:T-mismatch repair DNA endonuclease (very short patch repair protein)
VAFWAKKIDGNIARDARAREELASAGWRVETIWECSVDAGIQALLGQLRDH